MNEKSKQSKLAEEFISDFTIKKGKIINRIESLIQDTLNINDELTSISEDIQKLNKSLHDAVIYLPSYSVKVRQNDIRDLEKLLKEKEVLLLPKKKFGFKSTVKPKIISVADTEEKPEKLKEISSADMKKLDANYFTIEDLEDDKVTFDEDKLNGNDVMIRNLKGCTVTLCGSPSTVRIKNISNCKVICGPVRTSVFLENCRDSTLFLCCQQLRTHSSENVNIYLRVSSRAIIEDCHGIRFAPYFWKHPRSSALHALAGIADDLERYDAVDDFNWLSNTEASPNWSILPIEERIECL